LNTKRTMKGTYVQYVVDYFLRRAARMVLNFRTKIWPRHVRVWVAAGWPRLSLRDQLQTTYGKFIKADVLESITTPREWFVKYIKTRSPLKRRLLTYALGPVLLFGPGITYFYYINGVRPRILAREEALQEIRDLEEKLRKLKMEQQQQNYA